MVLKVFERNQGRKPGRYYYPENYVEETKVQRGKVILLECPSALQWTMNSVF